VNFQCLTEGIALSGRLQACMHCAKFRHFRVNWDMKTMLQAMIFAVSASTLLSACNQVKTNHPENNILFKNVNLIDGNGKAPLKQTRVLVQNGIVSAIGNALDTSGYRVIDLKGKTIMPSLISTHVHIGTLKGLTTDAAHYTRANILYQLKKYMDYGVGYVHVMGTDRPLLFETGLLDSAKNGRLPGARLSSAGYGFIIPDGPSPALEHGNDNLFRPSTANEVPAQMDTLAKLNVEIVKLWQDDFGGHAKKMDSSIYKAIITEAHKRKMRVAAHVYYLSDARNLINSGLDIIAHSVRDSLIDDKLVAEMKMRNTIYIPTLSLDEFSFIYARKPKWINDRFFKASLEPGVYEMITSPRYQTGLRKSAAYARNQKGFDIALKNLKILHDAGILIGMGTDSGAFPIRAQGFSEHLELELMVQAGLTPLEAIEAATKNSSTALQINRRFGTLETGKSADFLILSESPETNIMNTRKIEAVYKAGKEVSHGPHY
jgi:imidazolonepropionase-like amidohydrolase